MCWWLRGAALAHSSVEHGIRVTGEAASAFSRTGVGGREGYRLGDAEGVGSLFALAPRIPSVRRAT